MGILGSLFKFIPGADKLVNRAVDQLIPDRVSKAARERMDYAANVSYGAILRAEAASQSWLASSARPAILWVSALILLWNYVFVGILMQPFLIFGTYFDSEFLLLFTKFKAVEIDQQLWYFIYISYPTYGYARSHDKKGAMELAKHTVTEVRESGGLEKLNQELAKEEAAIRSMRKPTTIADAEGEDVTCSCGKKSRAELGWDRVLCPGCDHWIARSDTLKNSG
jgi:hypothetical protein